MEREEMFQSAPLFLLKLIKVKSCVDPPFDKLLPAFIFRNYACSQISGDWTDITIGPGSHPFSVHAE